MATLATATEKKTIGMSADEMHQVFAEWNNGELDSYLIEITRDIFSVKDDQGGDGAIAILGVRDQPR